VLPVSPALRFTSLGCRRPSACLSVAPPRPVGDASSRSLHVRCHGRRAFRLSVATALSTLPFVIDVDLWQCRRHQAGRPVGIEGYAVRLFVVRSSRAVCRVVGRVDRDLTAPSSWLGFDVSAGWRWRYVKVAALGEVTVALAVIATAAVLTRGDVD